MDFVGFSPGLGTLGALGKAAAVATGAKLGEAQQRSLGFHGDFRGDFP